MRHLSIILIGLGFALVLFGWFMSEGTTQAIGITIISFGFILPRFIWRGRKSAKRKRR